MIPVDEDNAVRNGAIIDDVRLQSHLNLGQFPPVEHTVLRDSQVHRTRLSLYDDSSLIFDETG